MTLILNAFQMAPPRGEDCPPAVPQQRKPERALDSIPNPFVRVLDSRGRPRAPLAPRTSSSIAIEGRAASQASTARRQALSRSAI